MTEKSKKFLSFFKAEKILMETLNKKQVRLYTRLRSFTVECEFDFSLAVTYLIKKERISKNLDKDLIQVVNIFKSIHNIPEKHPSTLLETFDRVDADFITTTCRYYADKKSKKPLTIPILPLLEFYNDSTSSDSKPVTDRLVLNDQCNQDVTKPLDIDKDKDKDIVIDIKEKNIKKEKPKKFIPPTLEEVTSYCQERGNNVNPQKFVDYYQSNGWKVGKNSMKDWKASVRTWEGNTFNTAPPKSEPFDAGKYLLEKLRKERELNEQRRNDQTCYEIKIGLPDSNGSNESDGF